MKNIRNLLIAGIALSVVACGDDVTRITQTGGGGAPTDPTVFNFRSDAVGAYTKVDRMGGPATTTALLMPGPAGGNRRQQANLTEPADDAQYAQEYISTLRTLHFELGPALAGLTLAACGVPGADAAGTDVSKCVAQALSNNLNSPVIPDVLRFDTRVASVYPNGRGVDDQVVDRLLATALLDLTDPAATCFGVPCTRTTLAALPLNGQQRGIPAVAPLASFPYFNNQMLAAPPAASP